MITIEKTKNGWFRIIQDGNIQAVVPDRAAAKKAITQLQKLMR